MDKIDGAPPLPLSSLLGQGQAQATNKPSTESARTDGSGSTEGSAAPRDRVTIDESTQVLRQSEASLDTEPPVDSDKVAKIRQAVADGSYEVNAGRVADSFLATESALFNK
ncbi:MAG: flagellar biosynthesis anti-sigma factor FlgM [Immundisolibacteraceae bacterium]|nr:flagellar biosynthesis anti-sigma factor FlgM [Immundisolibacteraceae bacterium]